MTLELELQQVHLGDCGIVINQKDSRVAVGRALSHASASYFPTAAARSPEVGASLDTSSSESD